MLELNSELQSQIALLKKREDDIQAELKAAQEKDASKIKAIGMDLLSMKGKTEIETQEHKRMEISLLDSQSEIEKLQACQKIWT